MAQMTESQAQYRNDLIVRTLDNLLAHLDMNKVLKALLAVNLPEPIDSRDASNQIDALKGDIRKYRTDHAQSLLDKLGNDGFAALIETVKSLTSPDHQADLAISGNRVLKTRQELTEALTI